MAYYAGKDVEKARGNAMRELILERRSIAQVARRYGKHRTTIWRWKRKWQAQQTVLLENAGRPNRPLGKTFRWNSVKWDIKTRSSAPHAHLNALDEKTVGAIMRIRKQNMNAQRLSSTNCIKKALPLVYLLSSGRSGGKNYGGKKKIPLERKETAANRPRRTGSDRYRTLRQSA